MIRFLHTADWQIGKLYGQFAADEAALLAAARFTAVERIAALARIHAVDLVLVAGDVFDAQGVSDQTIHRLFYHLSGYSGPWLMLPGNHDAALCASVWTRAARLRAIPSNVQICTTPTPITLAALGAVVLPAPLTQRQTHHDLTAWFDHAATPTAYFRLGLAHGSVQGILAASIDSTNPIAATRAATARLDYLALGDWHGTRCIDARTWYSGTPETDRFRANDSGQILLVEIAAPGALPVITPIACGQYCWRTHTHNFALASDVIALTQQLGALGANDVVQLVLSGQLDLAAQHALNAALVHTQGRVRSLAADLSALRLSPSAEDIAALAADGYLGDVIQVLRSDANGPDGELRRDALLLLAAALDERRAQAGGTAPT